MNHRSAFARLSTLAPLGASLALMLSACGGGGGGSSTSASSSGATASSYTGTVTGLGSVVINGVRFSTSGASSVDGDDSSHAYAKAFALGDTVTVTGSVNDDGSTGTATSITFHGGVRGKVTAVDCTGGTVTVYGQVIAFDSNTIWDGTTTTSGYGCSSLVAGTSYLEALGEYDTSTSRIKASRIVEKDSTTVDAEGVALRSRLTAISGTTLSLTINGVAVTVDASTATLSPSGVTLAVGDVVRVVVDPTVTANGFALSTIAGGSGTANLTATKVSVKRERHGDGTRSVVRGAITTISGSTWTINGVTVDVSQSPTLIGLSSLPTSTGTVVTVKGTYNSSGVLVAKTVLAANSDDDNRPSSTGGVKLYGVVSGSTAASGSTPATFVVQGVTVTIPLSSSIALPSDGVYAEVRAHLVSGVLTADSVSTSSSASRSFEVYGTAPCATGTAADFTGSSGFTLTLRRGGTATVNTTSSTTVEVESGVTSGTASSATCLLEVKGNVSTATTPPTITATKIEIVSRSTSGTASTSMLR